jgi:hypothetical protein
VTSESTEVDIQKTVIFLHGRALASGSGVNVKMSRRYAATRALKRLEDNPNILNENCNCRISQVKRLTYSKECMSEIY